MLCVVAMYVAISILSQDYVWEVVCLSNYDLQFNILFRGIQVAYRLELS